MSGEAGAAAAPFILGPPEIEALIALRDFALARPLHMPTVAARLKTSLGRAAHRKKMTAQTVVLARGPWPFFVTYGIETGHGAGICRHMSMGIKREGRMPHPDAFETVMPHLGFVGGIQDCYHAWVEDLSDGGKAVHVIQQVAMSAAAGTA